MNISRFFIDRPIFAGVISVFITLIGLFAYPMLPLSQYPEIAPPTITINAAYPGASAETLAETVAAPIEQEVNGVEKMLYLTSSSTSDGAVAIRSRFTEPMTVIKKRLPMLQRTLAGVGRRDQSRSRACPRVQRAVSRVTPGREHAGCLGCGKIDQQVAGVL